MKSLIGFKINSIVIYNNKIFSGSDLIQKQLWINVTDIRNVYKLKYIHFFKWLKSFFLFIYRRNNVVYIILGGNNSLNRHIYIIFMKQGIFHIWKNSKFSIKHSNFISLVIFIRCHATPKTELSQYH